MYQLIKKGKNFAVRRRCQGFGWDYWQYYMFRSFDRGWSMWMNENIWTNELQATHYFEYLRKQENLRNTKEGEIEIVRSTGE